MHTEKSHQTDKLNRFYPGVYITYQGDGGFWFWKWKSKHLLDKDPKEHGPFKSEHDAHAAVTELGC